MNLSDKQLLNDLLQNDYLKIKEKNHQRTWEYFHAQYHNAFCILLEVSKQKKYLTNRNFMPFLFLMRHSLELFLKNEIAKLPNVEIPNHHKIVELYNVAHINNNAFLELPACLKCDSEGDCWRYLSDKEGNRYFNNGEVIKAFDACNYYCSFLYGDNSLTENSTDTKFQWELTFHTRECDTLGIVGTQYDFATSTILDAIRKKHISINDVYLPLLFLLRHCLEIKLKAAISELKSIVAKKDLHKAQRTHSVKILYDILFKDIGIKIEKIEDDKFRKESIRLCEATKHYKDVIQSLDANSYLFRYPTDKSGGISNFLPNPGCVSKILKLYWESDPFLCFGSDILHEAGVLNIGDDKSI